MVEISEQKVRTVTERYSWTIMDDENNGFLPRNLNSTNPISIYDKNRVFGRPNSLLGNGEKKLSNQQCQHFQDTVTKIYHN
jgi:hypothetical protein